MKVLARLRQGLMTRSMAFASARRTDVEVAGLRLRVEPGVCHPAPALGFSFATLFEAALVGLPTGARVLDVGTGCGVWALLASRAGGDVTATDLTHVPLEPVADAARDAGLRVPRVLHGDLFEPVAGERFRRVLFNPPFHLGTPRTESERATLGGPHGEVLRRFLAELPLHLEPGGSGWVVLPRTERRAYEDALAPLSPEVRAHRTIPVLGRAELIRLTPR